MKTEDVTIIGAGPAGIATAIQLKRWGLDPLLLEAGHIGGLLVNANLVENYPGFPDGISGSELVKRFEAQLIMVGVVPHFEEVLDLDHDDHFILKTSEREFRSKFVVIASGTQPRAFDSINIPEEVSERVLYEVYPIANVEGKKIVIIGAGDAAFDYALNVSYRNEISILNRGAKRKCLPLLWERAEHSLRIEYFENTALSGIESRDSGMVLYCVDPQRSWEVRADYVIFAIGRKPQLNFLSQRLRERVDELEGEGKLYFVGDVKNDLYRQISIATGDGVRAAMRICRILSPSE
ncbi:MAG: NAD(P)/FAD-dependent oxidoreductase [Chloroflexi bacterium]|nr:NAD(P)/FAD-dependent oxidoreductase [Chloroflexota bacterium]